MKTINNIFQANRAFNELKSEFNDVCAQYSELDDRLQQLANIDFFNRKDQFMASLNKLGYELSCSYNAATSRVRRKRA